MSLKDRVAVVTGATGGLGQVVAQHLAQEGARLALFSRDAEGLQRLVAGLGLHEAQVLTRAMDLADASGAAQAAEAVLAKFGRAEILLHLVGGWTGGKAIVDVGAEEISSMLQQHVWTTFYVLRAFVPHLVASGWGRVIVVSSPHASRPPAKAAPYAIGKAGQEALILTLAQELKDTGVTANILLVRAIDERHQRDRERSPKTADWTTPEEIGSAILYLCSDEARMVNGARLPLYGSP